MKAGVFEVMVHDLRALLRVAQGRKADPSAAILDSRPLQSTAESGERAGYDGAKRKRGRKTHRAVDTLGYLLTLFVTPANEQDRAQVEQLTREVQEVTGELVELAFVDQGYTGEQPTEDAANHGIQLEVIRLPEARKGFVLLVGCKNYGADRLWEIPADIVRCVCIEGWLNSYLPSGN